MISKQSFVEIMDTLRDYSDQLWKFENVLNVQVEDNFLIDILYKVMDALYEDVESDLIMDDGAEPWIYYFAFDLDWGRKEKAKTNVIVDGEPYPLLTVGHLYDFLQEVRKRRGDSVYA